MKTGVSYFARSRLKHMQEDMEEIKRNNCSFAVHTFSETDYEFYRGTIEKLVKISHDVGLEVWLDPWGVGGVFGGESYSQFASCNLDSRQISSGSDSLPACCFNSSKFRKFMKEWIDAAVEIGADNIFWDEPHFYIYNENVEENVGSKLWTCKCPSCKTLFKSKYKNEIPSEMTKDLQEFKEESIVDFIKETSGYAKNKGLENSFCFLPFEGHIGGVRNWEKFAAIDSLDIIGTDPYWRTDRPATKKEVIDKVTPLTRKIKRLCEEFNKEPQIWILNFKIQAGTEDNIKTAIECVYKEGIRNIAAWSYYGTEMMYSLASENPAAVWKTLGEAYRRLIAKTPERVRDPFKGVDKTSHIC